MSRWNNDYRFHRQPKGTLTIKNNNPATGTFDVFSQWSEQSGGSSCLPTWSSAEGQDDLIWYRGVRQADGVYKLTVKASDHKYSTGEYHVHLYYVGDNGRMVGVGVLRRQFLWQLQRAS